MNIPRLPPDIEIGNEQHSLVPLIFGNESAELTPNTLKVIRKNAGRVPAHVIARALCWSFSRLKRVAQRERIDLRLSSEVEPRGA